MFGARWLVGGGALLVAIIALYVLLNAGHDRSQDRSQDRDSKSVRELRGPALDEIDDDSRSAMRDLLRQADSED
jgi:hypothetical protein